MAWWGGERPGPGWGHYWSKRAFTYLWERRRHIWGETVTSLWHSRNFLMLNFFNRMWNYNIQSYLFLVFTAHLRNIKEQSGAKETKTLCASRQFALFRGVQSMLGFSKGNKAGDFLMQTPSSSFIKNKYVFLRVEMCCPTLHGSIVSYLRQSLFINTKSLSHCCYSVPKSCLTLLWPHGL